MIMLLWIYLSQSVNVEFRLNKLLVEYAEVEYNPQIEYPVFNCAIEPAEIIAREIFNNNYFSMFFYMGYRVAIEAPIIDNEISSHYINYIKRVFTSIPETNKYFLAGIKYCLDRNYQTDFEDIFLNLEQNYNSGLLIIKFNESDDYEYRNRIINQELENYTIEHNLRLPA